MLNNEVSRATTDKQTHTHTHTYKKHTYRVKTEETFFTLKCFNFKFLFKKAVSNITAIQMKKTNLTKRVQLLV